MKYVLWLLLGAVVFASVILGMIWYEYENSMNKNPYCENGCVYPDEEECVYGRDVYGRGGLLRACRDK